MKTDSSRFLVWEPIRLVVARAESFEECVDQYVAQSG
jgi:hypothetical protein